MAVPSPVRSPCPGALLREVQTLQTDCFPYPPLCFRGQPVLACIRGTHQILNANWLRSARRVRIISQGTDASNRLAITVLARIHGTHQTLNANWLHSARRAHTTRRRTGANLCRDIPAPVGILEVVALVRQTPSVRADHLSIQGLNSVHSRRL